jgi:hypothetical protein
MGEVTYIGPWTKNGDGNFIATTALAPKTFAVFDVVIVGYPSNLPETGTRATSSSSSA